MEDEVIMRKLEGHTLENSSLILGWRKWEDLNDNILMEIFKRVSKDYKNLLFGPYHVCRSWRSACREVIFFEDPTKFDLSVTQTMFSYRGVAEYDDKIATNLMNLMKSLLMDGVGDNGALNYRNGSSIKELVLPPLIFGFNDEHLVYISQRLPKLKKLTMPCAEAITISSFSLAIRTWTELTEIVIGPLDNLNQPDVLLLEIGMNCENLEKLHLYGRILDGIRYLFDDNLANIVVELLPKLKLLWLESFDITQGAFKELSKNHQILEEVMCVNGCPRVYFTETIIIYRAEVVLIVL